MVVIDWNDFADWATKQTGNVDLNSSSHCAIAQYMKNVVNIQNFFVVYEYICVIMPQERIMIPKDIADYIMETGEGLQNSPHYDYDNPTKTPWSEISAAIKEMGYGKS